MKSHLSGEKVGPVYAVELIIKDTKSVCWLPFKDKETCIKHAKELGMRAFENRKQIYP